MSEEQHKVTLNLTVAKAFPTVEDELIKPNTKGIGGIKGRRRVYEAPKPHHYFHIEYKLLPNDVEPIKTDIVSYGVAAKIYMENESKVLKTWREGNKTWVAWTHSHKLTITKDLLLKLYNHTLEFKIWDTKDRVSPKARFDRPKAFRLPAIGEEGDDSCVRSLVMKQTKSFHSLQPKESVIETPAGIVETNGAEPRQTKSPSKATERKSESKQSDPSRATTAPSSFPSTSIPDTPTTPGQQSMVRVQVRIDENHTPQFGRLAQLAGLTPPIQETPRDVESSSRIAKSKADEARLTPRRRKSKTAAQMEELANKQKKHLHGKHATKRDVAAAAAAHVRVHGTATVSIKLSVLFSGIKTTTTRLEKPSGNIQDLLLSVNLDNPLLSETQRKELNPMVIQVNSASSMPNTPLSYQQLKDKCKPVHLEYQFYNQTKHTSKGREHGRDIFWSDIRVVLLGTIDQDLLAEYLQGPPLQIEVHDRDRKMKSQKTKPSIFGENPEDEMINNVALVAGRRTTHNPFHGRGKTWDPYGIAKFDLSGLLLGQTLFELRSPIHCCPIPDTNLGHEDPDGPIVGRPGNVDGPQSKPMPTANYLEAGSELKIKVNLAYPLNSKGKQVDTFSTEKPVPTECPFGRLVYIFKYSNSKFLRRIQNEITAINAEALELDSLPQHVIQAALSTYKLSKDQRKSTTLDIITGFQVLDGEFHIFLLEGIANEGIKRLWHGLPRPLQPDPAIFNVLYNSEMTFSSRLYASLDVDLCRVRLHEPLQSIAKNPLLYVRDLVPKPCFEALTKLDMILRVTKLREATQSDLFPSAAMIISMSREFGVPLTAEDFGELDELDSSRQRQAVIEFETSKTRRPWTPLQSHNIPYEKKLKERLVKDAKNFVQENIKIPKTMEKERPRTIAVDRSELFMEVAHNYSIQSLNTTELAKEKLRRMMAKEKDNCYTYCPRYNSAIVLPVEPDAVKKQEHWNSVQKWRTQQGFVFPGKKTSIESNFHCKKPDSARLDELNKEFWHLNIKRKFEKDCGIREETGVVWCYTTPIMQPWKENVLHSNILKPTVDREIFPWPFRDKDFDINLSRPRPTHFDLQPVKSVHAAGDIKEQELRQSQEAEARLWQEKVVVDDPIFRTHRCLTETELLARGRKASNQPAKLIGLLKDPPNKLALQKPGFQIKEIPSLAVVSDPSIDTFARNSGKLQPRDSDDNLKNTKGFNPGPFENEGWLLEKNKIPIIDSQHKKYEALRGQDFWLFHKEKDPVYHRRIEPLMSEEKDNHLFAVADPCS